MVDEITCRNFTISKGQLIRAVNDELHQTKAVPADKNGKVWYFFGHEALRLRQEKNRDSIAPSSND